MENTSFQSYFKTITRKYLGMKYEGRQGWKIIDDKETIDGKIIT